ncbi:MAG: DEAD/DEAH box helicase [Pseudomonadales bacterium]
MTTPAPTEPGFAELGLADAVARTVAGVGYETPTPIQARTIPPLLAGRDVLGQAQTGTGKTAAFALPLLSRIRVAERVPQVLVLTPTRELAIQVAEAFQRYAAGLDNLHVLPIYGGQDYSVQLKMLARGVHVVVGTPGRVMDHLRRGTLKLGTLQTLVLDEADEMLRMGFIDDVEWILKHTPPERQMALFSATLPTEVRRIARSHMKTPVEVRLEERTTSAASVRQRVWMVAGTHKLDALTRILEVETFDAMIVFVRTKHATSELAERLCARGFDAAAIHGDIHQNQRERLIANLRNGSLDILVATDVAARGLDVERVSHVINFDIPYDTEAYVHRIGRTGRAGRSGDAILFVAQRERHMLRTIERATGRPIETMDLPSRETINNVRVARFFEALTQTLASEDLSDMAELMARYQREHGADPLLMAAALAHQAQRGAPLLQKSQPERRGGATAGDSREPAPSREHREPARRQREGSDEDAETEVFRIEVGRGHGAEPRNIVGAIVNEAGVEPRYIGKIDMHDEYSLVELPVGMPKEIFEHLKTVWVSGRRLGISRTGAASTERKPRAKPRTPGRKRPAQPRSAEDER